MGLLAADAPAAIPVIGGAPAGETAVSFRWENDKAGGTDRFYTDGISLGVSRVGSGWLDPVADMLPWGGGRRTVTWDLTQGMFTPDDTEARIPDPLDRPYAGILTLGLTLHVEREDSYHGLKLVAGVLGPWSFAEETQGEFHRLIGAEVSEGWDHQLENEPIFNLAYEYRHKFLLAGNREPWSVEALPLAGGWLGNMLIQGQLGGILRCGHNMPEDAGPTLMRGMGHMPPPHRDPRGGRDWGWSVYGGAVANIVARDITLDGNTFEHGPGVDKKTFVPAAGVGASVGNDRMLASFSYVFWGREFEGQDECARFGAMTLTWFF